MYRTVVLFLLLAAVSSIGQGQIPKNISYQGLLSDSAGAPRPDGSYSFTFRLYESLSGGSPAGIQQQTLAVEHGLFHTVLDQILSGLILDRSYWLGIQVGTDPELSPRIPLTSVLYSIASIHADTANYALEGLQGGGNGPWQLNGSSAYYNGGKVGIGTSTPSHRLTIVDPSNGLRVETSNAAGSLASFGALGDFGIDAPFVPGGRFNVKDNGQVQIGYYTGFSIFSDARLLVVDSGNGGVKFQNLRSGGTCASFGAFGDFRVEGQSPDGRLVISQDGNIGMGTPADPSTKLTVQPGEGQVGILAVAKSSTGSSAVWGLNVSSGAGIRGTSFQGVGVIGQGSTNGVEGYAALPTMSGVLGQNSGGGYGVAGKSTGTGFGVYGENSDPGGYAGYFSGKISSSVLEIRGGSDLAEPFPFEGPDDAAPGTLMVIDEHHPGKLRISNNEYDQKVAGIVSGAGGIRPGLTLEQEGVTSGPTLVAIAGRVYGKADATNGPITPGDLLTSSQTPGHVMKAADSNRSNGAIVGKAMSRLESGKGLVLVLVNLQ